MAGSRSRILGTLVVLLVAAGCIRLGVWQLDRLEQRRAKNALVEARLALPPVTLGEALGDTAGVAYRRIRVAGAFDNTRTMVMAGRAHRGTPGVHVVTPLLPEGGGPPVLVDRGFVRAPDAVTIALEPLVVDTAVELTGLGRTFDETRPAEPGAARVDTVAAGEPGGRGYPLLWRRLDRATAREQVPYPVAPFYVQALPDGGDAEPPVAIGPPELDEGPHLGYAVQWFSFAAIALVGWIVLMLRRR